MSENAGTLAFLDETASLILTVRDCVSDLSRRGIEVSGNPTPSGGDDETADPQEQTH
jgi:hypothetical protein